MRGLQFSMARTLSVSIPHDLTEAEVKTRLVNGVADARQKYPAYLKNAHETWNGNTMSFTASMMGQTITGRIEVEPKNVNVHVDLPLLLAMLANKIRPQIEAEGRKLLERPKG